MPGYRAFIADDEEPKYRLEYFHNPQRWYDNLLDENNPIRDINLWSLEIKYINEKGDGVSDEINNLPNDVGGIYMFYIKGINLPFMENHILYIGRCKITDTQNIRKRAKEYYKDCNRPLILKMFRLWKDNLYYRFYADTDNESIVKNEIQLIRSILPPLNESIPDKLDIRPTVPAFK